MLPPERGVGKAKYRRLGASASAGRASYRKNRVQAGRVKAKRLHIALSCWCCSENRPSWGDTLIARGIILAVCHLEGGRLA